MENDVDYCFHVRSCWFLAAWKSSGEAQNIKKKLSEKDSEDCLMHKYLLVFFYSRFIQVNYVSGYIIMKESISISLNFYLGKKPLE
jgi:hypothetical protein